MHARVTVMTDYLYSCFALRTRLVTDDLGFETMTMIRGTINTFAEGRKSSESKTNDEVCDTHT